MKINVVDFKVDESKLSFTKSNLIDSMFQQAKYLSNAMVASGDFFFFNTKVQEVPVSWEDTDGTKHTEIRSIEDLPAQCKQDIRVGFISNLKTLATLKERGYKVGKIDFRKEVKMLSFNQYHASWRFAEGVDLQKHSKNCIKLAGIGFIYCTGFDNKSIQDIREWGPAKLVRKPDGLHILCTGYETKRVKTAPKGSSVGIDMGLKDAIVLSTGEKINFKYNEDKKGLRKAHQRLSAKKLGSKNYIKQKKKRQKRFMKFKNRKADVTNKFVSGLQRKYETICIQDESLSQWQQKDHGKKIQQGVLGRIKSRLSQSNTTRVVNKWCPTTKLCPKCGCVNATNDVRDRTYVCDSCGFTDDRDVKSAKIIRILGLQKDFLKSLPAERREYTPVESLTSVTAFFETLYASQ